MTLFNTNKFYDAIGRLHANSPSGGIDIKDIVAATMPAGGSGRSTTTAIFIPRPAPDDDFGPNAAGLDPILPIDGVNFEAELIASQDALDRGKI